MEGKKMIRTSEWVSTGHPDKTADFISSYILDRFIEKDPAARYALEVQIKNQYVTVGGEITSKAMFSECELFSFVKAAVNQVGYTSSYQKLFGKENTICGDDIVVAYHVSQQSPDIAKGVNADGWGDQGIFWGMAVNSPETDYMPKDWWLARKIGKHLYDNRIAGIDIKTQVTVIDDEIEEVIVAIPMTEKHHDYDIVNAIQFCCEGKAENITVNGTGRFVKHGSMGDCGTTGRKLAVDFYGGNCKIGGGSPWTKDGTKADLTLNLYAREEALSYIKENPGLEEVFCSISCRIGSPEIRVVLFGKDGSVLGSYIETIKPAVFIDKFGLNKPIYADLCKNGLFSREK